MLRRLINADILVGLVGATLFWVAVLGWLTSYSPSDPEKDACYQAAAKSGRSAYECESFWEKVTSDPIALFTLALAFSTVGLWSATIGLYRAGERQFGLAREEFISSHRAQLRLKHIWLASQDGQKFVGNLPSAAPLTVRLDIVNFGNTTAFVTIVNFVTIILRPGERLPQRPPYNEPGVPQFRIGPTPLGSGFILTHPVSDGRILSFQDIQNIRNGHSVLYFVGTIEYLDASGRGRQTGFCRHLEFSRYPAQMDDFGRFQIEKDPDYEWMD